MHYLSAMLRRFVARNPFACLPHQRGKIRALRPNRLSLEPLEDRVCPSSLSVTNTNDSGPGSLRAALASAANGDVITFNLGAQTIALTSGELDVTRSVTITGPGAGNLTISGSNSSRVFEIGGNANVSISGLTLAHGNTTGLLGGALQIDGGSSLTLADCAVINSTSDYGGGAYVLPGATLAASGDTFSGDASTKATGGGGALFVQGIATITDSTLANNTSVASGGAIQAADAAVTVTNSTLTNNTTSGLGGGIAVLNGGTLTVANSTLAMNHASVSGGAIEAQGSVTVTSCTIAGNSANAAGGIDNYYGLFSVTVCDNIVAGNSATIAPDVANAVTSLGHNLIGEADNSSGWVTNDLTGTIAQPLNAKLGPLQNNGGPTQTMLQQAGSPAIGAGSPTIQAYSPSAAPDPSKWSVNTNIPQGNASVSVQNGAVQLVNRGTLNTLEQYNPANGGLQITGTWQFNSTSDSLEVLTRSDGTPGGQYGEINNGIAFSASAASSQVSIVGHGNAVVGSVPSAALTFTAGASYSFDILDDGTNLRFTLTQLGNASNTATVTAQSTSQMPINLITFQNREFEGSNNIDRLSNVTISNNMTGQVLLADNFSNETVQASDQRGVSREVGVNPVDIGATASGIIATGTPIQLSYNSGSGLLTVQAANSTSAPATLNVSMVSGELVIATTGDTMSFGASGTPPGFALNPGDTKLTTTNTINNLTITGLNGTTDTADTVNFLTNVSFPGTATSPSTLSVSAETINLEVGVVVNADIASLTSVNSLTFQSTGVPYLGNVTVHAGPSSGQPYAGDPYITGPDWGSYSYAPGDTITIANANNGTTTLSSGPYGVVAVIGDKMYLNDSNNTIGKFLSPNLLESFSDVTVQCSGFTSQLQASEATLDVTGAGSTISGALATTPGLSGSVNYSFLAAATAGGNISLQNLPPTNTLVYLGALNAGAGTIQLTVNGTVDSAQGGPSTGFGAGFVQQYINAIENNHAVNLTADAVDLTTTGNSSSIGTNSYPITTQSGSPGQGLELTGATNDGGVYVQDSSPAGLTINSILADTGGQAATVSDDQVVYNTSPGSSNPKYASMGGNGVTISSTGPIVLNSVSAAGDVTITGEYLLEGNAQSPNIIAPEVGLTATGAAEYQGQVAFATGAHGDTLTLPETTASGATAPTWSSLGFAAGDPVVVSGALASADDGTFTIASVSLDGYTITLTQSYVLTPETDGGVTVGDGMIGQASAAIALSDVPLFAATTQNGAIYLEPGNGVDSTAVDVSAGGMHGMANGVSVTSNASFLTIEDINATGQAAVTANSGALLENNGGTISGQFVSLTSPYNIGTAASQFLTDATSGLTVAATATSPSSAGIDIYNTATSPLTAIGVSTYDGSVTIQSAAGGLLSFDNSVLSETGGGNAVVTFANTDDHDGSNGDVIVSGTVYASSIVAGISSDGTAGAGQILTNPATVGTINGSGGGVMLSAGSGIGVSGTSLNITNATTLDATTNTGDIDVTDGSTTSSPLTLSAATPTGGIHVTWNGDIDLASEVSSAAGIVLDSISAPGTVSLDAVGGAIADAYGSTVSAGTLVVMAANGIGTASYPLETSSRGTQTLTAAAGAGLFLNSNTALNVSSATAGNGDLSISAAGNVSLQGNVSGGNVTLTATVGTLTATAANTVTATTGTLTIAAEQIGTPTGVMQTNASTINAVATYGGIYLSNNNDNTLTLTAAAVGTSGGATANNVEIYNAGPVVLQQQATALTQQAASVPIALFNPGGALTLFAGETLSADGTTASGSGGLTILSATPFATASSTIDGYGDVSGLTLSSAGSGYTSPPTVTISGGGGSGATASATINASGQVTGITITNAGSGYTSAPTITIATHGDDIYTGTYDINGTTVVSSSAPAYLGALVIVSNTAEVPVSLAGNTSIPALITLADLTALAYQTNGNGTVPVANGTETVAASNGATTVTITAGAITIDNLGQNGIPGTAILPPDWSLVLNATGGSVVFLNLGDTIATRGIGSITVTAGTHATDVAALGNLTTGGGNITISAGGNIGVGTLTAGKTGTGTVSVTSANGAILFSSAASPTISSSSTTLTEAAQPVYSSESAALAQLNATEEIAAADAASAQAVSAVDAAGAQAAAELALVNSLHAALTSIQAAVLTDTQTYQAAVTTATDQSATVDSDKEKVDGYAVSLNIATGVAASAGLVAAGFDEYAKLSKIAADFTLDIPFVNILAEEAVDVLETIAASLNLVSAIANVAVLGYLVDLSYATGDWMTDTKDLIADQANQAQAYAQLQADEDTETALTAAYDVAEQAYTSSEKAYANAETNVSQVQAEGDTAQAIAIANVVYAAPSQPITATGSGPVNIRAMSPLTVSANVTSATAINLAAAADLPSTAPGDDLTVNSGVTVQSTGSAVTLFAGDNVFVQSGSIIEGASPITITANGYDDANGTTVTVAGTLLAPSASIGVDPAATGNETFNITPSATTPIAVDGGSDSSGANTLNFNAEGLPVTVAGDTITAAGMQPVTFTNIQVVNITNAAGSSLTLDGTSAAANTMSLVGTGPEAGTATLNGVAFSFSDTTSFNYQGGAGDTIAVTPFAGSNVPWNLAVAVAGGAGAPAHLTYTAAGPDDTVTATGNGAGSVVEPGVATVPFSNVSQVTVVDQGIANVELVPNLAVNDAGGVYNGRAFSATVQVNGAASLDGIKPTLAYYSGTLVSPQHQLSRAPTNAGTYTVVTAFAGDATYVGASASRTFTIAPGTPNVSVNPVKLTYGTALANSQLKGTATFMVNGSKVNVPGTYTYTSAAGTVLAASASAYTEAVTFTPNSSNYATQMNLSVLVTVGKAKPAVTVNTVNLSYGTGLAPDATVNTVNLIHGAALANRQLSGTATFIVNGSEVSVPGTYTYTAKAGRVLAASARAYTEQVTFKPNDTTNYVTQTNLNVTVIVRLDTVRSTRVISDSRGVKSVV